MSLHIGTQLVAPEGFQGLEQGRTYYMLKSDPVRERVLLVYFVERPLRNTTAKAKRQKQWRPPAMPHLVGVSRGQFEHGLTAGKIVKADTQRLLPPWLAALEGLDLAARDHARKNAKRSHEDRIDAMLEHIWPLLQRLEDVLGADSPCAEINRHARACTPVQHETRLRLAFYSYLLFGRNRAALHYAIVPLGRWNRLDEKHRGKKLGRERKYKGRHYGFGANDPELLDKVYEGYRRFSGLGVHMNRIYRETLIRVFGCKAACDERGRYHYYHPDGKPFPSKGQFSYHVKKYFKPEVVYLTKYGAARTRNRLLPSLGKFTESVANLMERTEHDAFYVKELPRGYVDGEPTKPMCVVRLRCAVSGLIVGVGFALGSETARAYRMARFCEAVDKVRYCGFFGMPIEHWQWPSQGLSPHGIDDRGPGSSAKAQGAGTDGIATIIELTPSHMPQSKAGIESAHPRSVRIEGKPTYIASSMTESELAVREIFRVLRDNQAGDASRRFNPEHFFAGVETTPLALWNHLDSLGRNDAVPMAFDDAVRAFLEEVEVSVRADGVYLQELRYDSPALRETGVLNRVPSQQRFTLRAFVLDTCTRQIWVDVKGRLIEVVSQFSIASGDETANLSLTDLTQSAELRRAAAARADEHRDAVTSAIEREFEEMVGHPFEDGKRRTGRAKTGTPAARQEMAEAKRYMHAEGKR